MRKLSSAFTSMSLIMSVCPRYMVLKSVSLSNLSELTISAYTPLCTSRYSDFSLSGLPPKFTWAFNDSFSCSSLYGSMSHL